MKRSRDLGTVGEEHNHHGKCKPDCTHDGSNKFVINFTDHSTDTVFSEHNFAWYSYCMHTNLYVLTVSIHVKWNLFIVDGRPTVAIIDCSHYKNIGTTDQTLQHCKKCFL